MGSCQFPCFFLSGRQIKSSSWPVVSGAAVVSLIRTQPSPASSSLPTNQAVLPVLSLHVKAMILLQAVRGNRLRSLVRDAVSDCTDNMAIPGKVVRKKTVPGNQGVAGDQTD